jgi:hypothetical protein
MQVSIPCTPSNEKDYCEKMNISPSEERNSARNNYYFTLMFSRVSDISLPPLY